VLPRSRSIHLMLLENPGRVVTREELQQRLWPGDTFVDFDHSLNAAIQRLREALNDSADTPRYIETLPRRGYRFICPTEQSGEVAQPRFVGLRLFHPLRPRAAESRTDSALQGAVDLSQEGRGTVPGAEGYMDRVDSCHRVGDWPHGLALLLKTLCHASSQSSEIHQFSRR